jgi:hypothetical protein
MEGQIHGGTELGMFAPLKSMFAKPLTLQVQHPELGVLVYCCGIWFGTVQRRGRKEHFSVAGTDSAPDAGLLIRLVSFLARFDQVERMGSDFLRSREPIGQAEMELYSFDLRCADKPDDFGLVFSANGDDSRQWHVTFEAGQPQYTGPFDD